MDNDKHHLFRDLSKNILNIGIALVGFVGVLLDLIYVNHVKELEVYFTPIAIITIALLVISQILRILAPSKSKKIQSKTNEESMFDRQSYSNHIRDLFGFAESVRSSSYPQYMDAIYELKNSGQKKMILQHFFTHYRNPDTQPRLYDLYRKVIVAHNQLKPKREEIIDFLRKYPDFKKFGLSEPNSDDWQRCYDFHKTIGIYAHDLYENNLSSNYSSDFLNLYDDFPIEWDDNKKEWIIRDSTHEVVSSKSKEKLEEFLAYVKKHNAELREKADKINDNFYPRYKEIRIVFGKQFTEIYEPSRNGNPVMGVCDGCIEYFNGMDKSKYRKILANFNSKNENWDISLWL